MTTTAPHADTANSVTVPDAKLVATLQARAALAGHRLVRCPEGSFIVSCWNLTRPLADVAAVEAFLRRVGAP